MSTTVLSVEGSLPTHRCTACRSIPWQELLEKLPPPPETVDHEICQNVRSMLLSAVEGCQLCNLLLGAMDMLAESDLINEQIQSFEPVNLKLIRIKEPSPSASAGWGGWAVSQPPVPTSTKISVHVSVGSLAGGNLTLSIKSNLGKSVGQLSTAPSTAELGHFWLQDCLNGHKQCDHDDSIIMLPTRVLDVGSAKEDCEPCLAVTNGTRGRYCALSYCWGTTQNLKTTRATFDEHLKAIPIKRMGRTLQDAVTITRRLGVQYLWVDTLCIIQDDSNDWQRESAQMGQIYEQSLLTIAALSASDGEDGCLFDYNKFAVCPCEVFPGAHLVRAEIQGMRQRLTNAPLQRRAWTFQESYLPRRILYCERQMLLWHCQSGFRSEFDPTFFCQIGSPRKKVLACRDQSMFFYSLEDWQNLVMEYTKRQMTFNSDKLPAFSGIAEVFGRYVAQNARLALKDTEKEDESRLTQSLPCTPALNDAEQQDAPSPRATGSAPNSAMEEIENSDIESLSDPENPTREGEILDNGYDRSHLNIDANSNATRCDGGKESMRAPEPSEGDPQPPSRSDDERKPGIKALTNEHESDSPLATSPTGSWDSISRLPVEDEPSGLMAADQYICGFWKDDLISGLVWTYPTENTGYRPPSSHRPPTWSWVAAEGPVRFPFSPRDDKLFAYADLLSIDLYVPGANPFGQVSTAKMTLEGPVLPVPFFVDDQTDILALSERHSWTFSARKPAGLWLSSTNDTQQWVDPGTVDLDSNQLSPHAICLRVCSFRCLLLEPVVKHRPVSSNTESQVYRRAGVWSLESVLRKLLTDASGPWTAADVISAIHEFGDPMYGRHPEDLLENLYAEERMDIVEASFGMGNWERRVVTII